MPRVYNVKDRDDKVEEPDFLDFDKPYQLMPGKRANFIISGEISTNEKWYNPLIHALNQSNEGTEIIIKMNTHGGDLFASDVIVSSIHAAAERGAKISLNISGKCMSAGTFILGACIGYKNIEIYVSSETVFLFHLGYTFSFGNVVDNNTFSNYMLGHVKELAKKHLSVMLTEEEMELVILGRDFILNGAVVVDRIRSYVEQKNEEYIKTKEEKEAKAKEEKELFKKWKAECKAALEKQTKVKKPAQNKKSDEKIR